MQVKKRWIAAVIETSATLDVAMPWERGARRAETIARRDSDEDDLPRALGA